MNLSNIFLQASGGQDGAGGGGLSMILMMVAFFVIIYFFMIRPQQKRQKDVQKAREAIQPGDKVLTSGGLYGKVKEISDKYMLVEIAEGVKVRVEKGHVFAIGEEAQNSK